MLSQVAVNPAFLGNPFTIVDQEASISTDSESSRAALEYQSQPNLPAPVEIEEEIEKYDRSLTKRTILGDINCLNSRIEFPLYSLDIPNDVLRSIWKPPKILNS